MNRELLKVLQITDTCRDFVLTGLNIISDLCHSKKEPVFITKNGYGALVVLSLETYESMLDDYELDLEIARA